MNPQLLLLVVAMVAIFYFLILRPQQRQKRKRAELMDALEAGVEVLTVGGIYGRVVELRDEEFDLEIADGVVMKMDRRAIASVIRDTDDADGDDADGEPVDEDADEAAEADATAGDADGKS